jgi:dethiobiotin synthase
MIPGIFITGTGTDVGKTMVTAGLLAALRGRGVDAVPMKPVQTGAVEYGKEPFPLEEPPGGEIARALSRQGLCAPDLFFSLAAAELRPSPEELDLMAPFCYEPACSPHLAGNLTGFPPDSNHIQDCVDELVSRHETVLVEGAGGVLAPLNGSETMLDLMVKLGFPVLLVASNTLGTINHTLLSIQVLRQAGLDLLGVVFNNTSEPLLETRFISTENPLAVARFGKVPILGNLRYTPRVEHNLCELRKHFETDADDVLAVTCAVK